MDVPPLVLVDLPLVVALMFLHHVPRPGGCEMSSLHHSPVACIVLLLAMARLSLMLTGVIT